MVTGVPLLHLLFRLIVAVFVSYYVGSGNYFLRRSGRERKKEDRLKQKGDTVTGHITRHLFNLQSIPCTLTYSYEYEEKAYENTQIAHPTDFNHFADGDAVAVRFLPDDPKIAVLAQIDPSHRASRVVRKVAWIYFIKAFLIILFVTLLIVWGFLSF